MSSQQFMHFIDGRGCVPIKQQQAGARRQPL
jgi:hypothetical protein